LTKTNAEQAEKLDKLKKQHDAYEVRVQELKQTRAAEQTALEELDTKLRTCERERDQLAKRDAENGKDTKKTLSSVEAKRREDVKERDRKVAELEKTLVAERKKREMLESCLDDVRKKADEDVVTLRAESRSLQQQRDGARKDGEEARRAAEAARDEAENREEELLVQLEQCRTALGRVAEEYARLASTTVTAKAHATLKEEHLALQSRSLRLERKLANSEGQVTELAHLIRLANEESKLLFEQLRDAEEEVGFYSGLLQENRLDRTHGRNDEIPGLEHKLAALGLDIVQGHAPATLVEYHDAAHNFYRDLADDMRLRVDVLENATHQERSANRALAEEVASHVALRQASSVELQRLQTELAEANRTLANEQVSLAALRQSRDDLHDTVNVLEKQLGERVSQHKAALQKERDIAQKLSMQLGMSKTAEDTLRADMEQYVRMSTDHVTRH
jgi:chromosome segregation ATPase